jgi:hypothetical protein
MIFQIPPLTYHVKFMRNMPTDLAARHVVCTHDAGRHEIEIWQGVHGDERHQLIFHELEKACKMHIAEGRVPPSSLETLKELFELELKKQGGDAELDSLRAGDP